MNERVRYILLGVLLGLVLLFAAYGLFRFWEDTKLGSTVSLADTTNDATGDAPDGVLAFIASDTLAATGLFEELNARTREIDGLKGLQYESMGSSIAIAKLIEGSKNFIACSRAIGLEDLPDQTPSPEITPFVLGYEPIVVVAHPDNGVAALSTQQLRKVFCGKVARWEQVSDQMTGSINIYHQGDQSGTKRFFHENALGKCELPAHRGMKLADMQRAISEDRQGIGYLGRTSIMRSDIKMIALMEQASRDRPVAPLERNLVRGLYPLSRPLYLYARTPVDGKARGLFDFLQSEEGARVVRDVGLIPMGGHRELHDLLTFSARALEPGRDGRLALKMAAGQVQSLQKLGNSLEKISISCFHQGENARALRRARSRVDSLRKWLLEKLADDYEGEIQGDAAREELPADERIIPDRCTVVLKF